jgi:hypothetical protein
VVSGNGASIWILDSQCAPVARLTLPSDVQPVGIAPEPEGGWIVSDERSGRLLWVDGAGIVVKPWGGGSREETDLRAPCGLAVADDTLLVADRDDGCVRLLDWQGNAAGSYHQLAAPVAVAADAGSLWVAEWRRRGVRRLARSTGEPLELLTHPDLFSPVQVVTCGSVVLVADHVGARLHAFSKSGEWLGALDSADGRALGRLVGLLVLDAAHGLLVDHEHGWLVRFTIPTPESRWPRR